MQVDELGWARRDKKSQKRSQEEGPLLGVSVSLLESSRSQQRLAQLSSQKWSQIRQSAPRINNWACGQQSPGLGEEGTGAP